MTTLRDLALDLLESRIGKSLSRARARILAAAIENFADVCTRRRFTFGPEETNRIARNNRVDVTIVRNILHDAGANCVDAPELAEIWAADIPDVALSAEAVTLNRDAIEREVIGLLHASRDAQRNASIDTRHTHFRTQDSYYAEAFGVMRALRALGVGYFGTGENAAPVDLGAWFRDLQQRVLDEEHFGTTNVCEYCYTRYGHDAARPRRSA